MRAHRSLTRLDVLKYAPDQIARMVASEFWRASDRAQYPTVAENCFHRARELMGLLETVVLPESVAQELKPYYDRSRASCLFGSMLTDDKALKRLGVELAEAFERVAQMLSERPFHA